MRIVSMPSRLAVVVGVLLALGTGASASAQDYFAACPLTAPAPVDICGDRLVFDASGAITPRALPRRETAAVTAEVRGSVSTARGRHPSALREAVVDFDRHAAIDAAGLPACGRRQLERRGTKAARRLCRGAIVGSGVARVGVEALGAATIEVPLTLFNGGVAGGVTTIVIHGAIGTAEPSPTLATVKIAKARSGRYGSRTTWTVPSILDGGGSLLDFHFTIGRRFQHMGVDRGYLTARCTDGRLRAQVTKAVFRNEAEVPGVAPQTLMRGSLLAPCSPGGSVDGVTRAVHSRVECFPWRHCRSE